MRLGASGFRLCTVPKLVSIEAPSHDEDLSGGLARFIATANVRVVPHEASGFTDCDNAIPANTFDHRLSSIQPRSSIRFRAKSERIQRVPDEGATGLRGGDLGDASGQRSNSGVNAMAVLCLKTHSERRAGFSTIHDSPR